MLSTETFKILFASVETITPNCSCCFLSSISDTTRCVFTISVCEFNAKLIAEKPAIIKTVKINAPTTEEIPRLELGCSERVIVRYHSQLKILQDVHHQYLAKHGFLCLMKYLDHQNPI